MSKPSHFRTECIVVQRSDYRTAQDPGRQGFLNIGRVVWLAEPLQPKATLSSVMAYVEPIGVVHLDPQCLVTAPIPSFFARNRQAASAHLQTRL